MSRNRRASRSRSRDVGNDRRIGVNSPRLNELPRLVAHRSRAAAILDKVCHGLLQAIGVAMLEYSKNLSVGRGTDAPFEQIGAGWIDGPKLAAYLNGRHIPGVRLYPVRFHPTASYFKDKDIDGVRFVLTDRQAFDAVRLGLEIGVALQKLYPGKIDFAANGKLIGSAEVIAGMKAGDDPRTIQGKFDDALAGFVARRKAYLLY